MLGAEESLSPLLPSQLAVEHAQADVNGVRLHYVWRGEGEPVVLLHGFPETWWSWRHQVEPLARAGYRVIAPDLRGYGASDKRGPFDLDTLAADVRGLVRALGYERARIVGHDWGGAIAWELGARSPELCERLAVLCCPHPAAMRAALVSRPSLSQIKRSWYMGFFQLPWLPERMFTSQKARNVGRAIRGNALDRKNFAPEELAPFREAALLPGAASAMLGYYRDALPQLWRPSFAPVELPVLLVWAMQDMALGYDDLVPETLRWAPKAKVERIDGCGHFVQAERPEQLNQLLLRHLA